MQEHTSYLSTKSQALRWSCAECHHINTRSPWHRDHLLMYRKLRKRRWFCFKHSSSCEWPGTDSLQWTVLSTQVAEIKYYYFSSTARYKIYLLKFCFAPSAKCPSKQRLYVHIQKRLFGPKMDKPPR